MRRIVLPLLISVGALATIIGTFLPWLRSGRHDRNSFQLLSLLNFLGFASDGPMGWAVRLWPVIPLVCVVAAVAAWRGMWPVAVLAGIGGGGYALGLAYAVRTTSSTSLLQARWGVTFTLVSALLLMIVSAVHAGLAVRAMTDDE